ncbi:MAG: diguanylate cyclase [Treponema sp.]|nr:diguanylate cyclase [Treponema sp.]
MEKFYSNWRYYKLGEGYKNSMNNLFPENLINLIRANTLVAVLTISFAIFPIITEHNLTKAKFYLVSAVAAIIMITILVIKYNHKINNKIIGNWLIYLFIFLYYINIMFIGLYLAVWAEPAKIAGSYIGILICALLPFIISPVLYLCIIICTLILYIMFIVLFKIPTVWNYDIQNAVFACIISIVFGWYFNMHRMTSAYYINRLESENTVDALTQLKNRKDFMQTFHRYVSNHRSSDKFLCIALLDVDCFKSYNDHYGHPQGDECLRRIGNVLNHLNKERNIYTARIGGEEFAMLWYTDNDSEADNIGAYINQRIRDLNITHEKSFVMPYITVSIGIHIAECGNLYDIKDLYNLADKLLYDAKSKGRNCTVVSA